jgi:hypothetical protein
MLRQRSRPFLNTLAPAIVNDLRTGAPH